MERAEEVLGAQAQRADPAHEVATRADLYPTAVAQEVHDRPVHAAKGRQVLDGRASRTAEFGRRAERHDVLLVSRYGGVPRGRGEGQSLRLHSTLRAVKLPPHR